MTARKWTAEAYKTFREQSKVMTNAEKDLSAQLRALPKFHLLKSKFAVHINLGKECSDIFTETGLERLISLEQEIATGVNDELKKVGEPSDLVPMMQMQNISKENKIRLLMMYYATNPKATEPQKRKILESNARLTEPEEKLITNWLALKNQSTSQSHQRAPTSDEGCDHLARYLPKMHDIVNDLAKGTLSVKEFPFLNRGEESECKPLVLTSAPSKRGNWDKPKSKESRPRIFVFIVGGCSYSEIRVAHALSQKELYPDVVIGSTHILNPSKFVKQVAALASPQGVQDPAFIPQYIGKDAIELSEDE